jgi:hypothetical protein
MAASSSDGGGADCPRGMALKSLSHKRIKEGNKMMIIDKNRGCFGFRLHGRS